MALRRYKITSVHDEASIRLVVIGCGPCILALPSGLVRGILTRQEAGTSETISFAGGTYTATDLAARLGIPLGPDSFETRIILFGTGACRHAFTVDQVYELIEVGRRSVRPLPTHFRNQERIKLSGYLLYQDTIALLVNPSWLLETQSLGGGTEADRPLLQAGTAMSPIPS